MIIACIIQARMGSTRLPGKVLMPLCDQPMLWHIINRVSHSQLIDCVIVATTTNPEDDAIELACKKWGVLVFRGNANDVLKRYCDAVVWMEQKFGAIDYIVRITADCPLVDPHIIDKVILKTLHGGYEYVNVHDPPSFPDGLDVEVITRDALFYCNEKAVLSSDREHVTTLLRRDTDIRKSSVQNKTDLSDLRWTVDTQSDYDYVTSIYNDLYNPITLVYMEDVIELLKRRVSY